MNYYWLKTIYVEFSKNDLLKSGDIETDEHGLICICLLKLMLQMLDIISDIEDHKNELKAYDINVDDEGTLQAVFNIFREKFKDEFNFMD